MKKPSKPDAAREVPTNKEQKDGRDVLIIPTDQLDEFIDKESAKRKRKDLDGEQFRESLARSLTLTGQWITDNAEKISKDIEGWQELEVFLRWEKDGLAFVIKNNICIEAVEAMDG